MPLPSNYSTRTVHGRWIAFPDGAPATGTITFRASVAHLVSSSDELVILTRPISADLDGNGEATVDLPTTSDPDISPTGFTYAVTETLGANGTERAYSIDVPEDTVNLELATVTPVAAVDDASPYLLVADRGSPGGVAALDAAGLVPRAQLPTTVDSVNGETGDVTLNASDVGALPDTFTAPVQSVNTFTGDVSLSASDVGAAGSGHDHDADYAPSGHTHPADALDDLTDVDTSTTPPAGGQALIFDGTATVWEPGDVAEAGHNHDAAYAPAGHGHDYPVDSVDGRTGAVTLGDLYADAGHSHAHPVTSVNTETGDVSLNASDVGASPDTHHHDAEYAALGHDHDFPVDSVDGRTGVVTLDDLYAAAGHDHDAAYAAAGHSHSHPVDSVDGRTGAVTLGDLYSDSGHNHDAAYAAAGHSHSHPVDSVNGETGNVNLSAADVGAATELIEEVVLATNDRVEFTNIPQGFRNLRIEWSAWHNGTGADSSPRAMLLRFNDHSSSSYYTYLRAFLANQTTEHDAANPGTTGRIGYIGGDNTNRSTGTIHVNDYASTGNDKIAYGTGYAVGGGTLSNMADFMAGTMWNVSTDPVTKIALFVVGGGFSLRSGSTFSLYGER